MGLACGDTVLTAAVLAIVLTAPLGRLRWSVVSEASDRSTVFLYGGAAAGEKRTAGQGRDDTAEAGRNGENLQKGGKGLPAAKKYLIIMRYILDQSVSCCLIRRIKDKKSNHK